MKDLATEKRKVTALYVRDERSLRWKFIQWPLTWVFYTALGSSPFPHQSCLDTQLPCSSHNVLWEQEVAIPGSLLLPSWSTYVPLILLHSFSEIHTDCCQGKGQ